MLYPCSWPAVVAGERKEAALWPLVQGPSDMGARKLLLGVHQWWPNTWLAMVAGGKASRQGTSGVRLRFFGCCFLVWMLHKGSSANCSSGCLGFLHFARAYVLKDL